MLDALMLQCKDQRQIFKNARFIMIQQNEYQYADFLTIGWMLAALADQKKVTFITFRQNYAHYLSLSKKLGKSLEGYLKSKQLNYVECFESEYCSDLPLTETQPQTYVSPPSLVRKLHTKDLVNEKECFQSGQIVVIDSIGYIEERVELCFWLYQQAMVNECSLVMGGCCNDGEVTMVLQQQAQLLLRLENDVGGHGKITIKGGDRSNSVLWKMVNKEIQFMQQITI